MTAYVALLRAVNVGGTSKLEMAKLKRIAEELGFDSPRTYIASGNLLFVSEEAEEPLRRALEKRLQDHMGKEVRVMLRTAEEIAGVVDASPFPQARANNVQAFFLNDPPPADLLDTLRNKAEDERVAAGVREVYVAYGERGIGRSRLRIPAAEPGTARNMNTVAKLAELAREMA